MTRHEPRLFRLGVPTVAGPWVLTMRESIVMFLFVVCAFSVVTFRTELQQNRIEANTQRIAMQRWTSCAASVPYVQRFNSLNTHLAEIYEAPDYPDPKAGRELAAEYRAIIIRPAPTLAQCGPSPDATP